LGAVFRHDRQSLPAAAKSRHATPPRATEVAAPTKDVRNLGFFNTLVLLTNSHPDEGVAFLLHGLAQLRTFSPDQPNEEGNQ
jgi:hypothetical protein